MVCASRPEAGRGGAGWAEGGGAEGRIWRGLTRRGPVGSRQINMESIFHEKVSAFGGELSAARWRAWGAV